MTGDRNFHVNEFDEAVELYTKCLDSDEEGLRQCCRANRSACYLQMKRFVEVIFTRF